MNFKHFSNLHYGDLDFTFIVNDYLSAQTINSEEVMGNKVMELRDVRLNNSYWIANCKRVVRRKRVRVVNEKDPFPYAKRLKEDFVRKESSIQPLFIQKSPPKAEVILDLSPEKTVILPKEKEKQEPIQLNYNFGYHSIRCKRITYNT